MLDLDEVRKRFAESRERIEQMRGYL